MKECLGRYDYKKNECLECPERIACMERKFTNAQPLEWSENSLEPSCFGSYKGTEDCLCCFFLKDCKRVTKEVKGQILRRGKHVRIGGKYKGRGKWEERDVY